LHPAMGPDRLPASDTRGRNKQPRRIDQVIGQRIRLQRAIQGLTQSDIAGKLGVAVQQVQKYETGQNRISAGRLLDIAREFNVPVSWFYEDVASDVPPELRTPISFPEGQKPAAARADDIVDLLTNYQNIASLQDRQFLVRLARILATGRP
jgi:transcriptional regulator with XRE-family HTH domain